MAYIEGRDRNKFLIKSLNDMVSAISIVRIIDAFVESLDLSKLSFTKAEEIDNGRPSYSPKCLLKLYIWGYKNGIHSSRKLAESCQTNIEVMWLLEDLKPDFRTISDFRKDNVKSMSEVFYKFNEKIYKEIELGFQSVDGTKIQAYNSKDRNFTQNKLDDRIKWLDEHIANYISQMDRVDATESVDINGEFTKDELENKLKEANERLERYKGYKKYMEENNLSQLSLTDKDSKLMKSKNGFIVGYNVQTAIDSKTHLITAIQTTNNPTDHGLLNSTVERIKKTQFPEKTLSITADKGYEKVDDIVKCLENGIVPNVIDHKEKGEYNISIDYKASKCDSNSVKPNEISKCLHAGIVPEVYKDVIENIKITEGTTRVNNKNNNFDKQFVNKDEMLAKAKEGYFVRDAEANAVYCPAGETLNQSAVMSNGNIRYRNKFVCKKCPYKEKCFSGKSQWKDIDFNKDTIIKAAKWLDNYKYSFNPKIKVKESKIIHTKKVQFVFKTDKQKMSQRFSLSEHPFGTIKRIMNGTYFLLKGKTKVDAEFSLLSLGYNLQRTLNIMGFDKLINVVTV